MHIFLSWSKEYSKEIAISFRNWLPCVLQDIEPFMSSQDISAGSDWYIDIKEHLNDATVGIIFLTPENINSPWLNFESGALSVSLNESKKVIPLIFGETTMETVLSSSPLKHFQSVLYPTKDGFHDLLVGLNDMLPHSLDQDVFEKTFNIWWPDLDEKLKISNEHYLSTKNSAVGEKQSTLDDKAVLAQIDKKMDLIIRRDTSISRRPVNISKELRTSDLVRSDLKKALVTLRDLIRSSEDENTDIDIVELKNIYRKFSGPINYLIRSNSDRERRISILENDND